MTVSMFPLANEESSSPTPKSTLTLFHNHREIGTFSDRNKARQLIPEDYGEADHPAFSYWVVPPGELDTSQYQLVDEDGEVKFIYYQAIEYDWQSTEVPFPLMNSFYNLEKNGVPIAINVPLKTIMEVMPPDCFTEHDWRQMNNKRGRNRVAKGFGGMHAGKPMHSYTLIGYHTNTAGKIVQTREEWYAEDPSFQPLDYKIAVDIWDLIYGYNEAKEIFYGADERKLTSVESHPVGPVLCNFFDRLTHGGIMVFGIVEEEIQEMAKKWFEKFAQGNENGRILFQEELQFFEFERDLMDHLESEGFNMLVTGNSVTHNIARKRGIPSACIWQNFPGVGPMKEHVFTTWFWVRKHIIQQMYPAMQNQA